MEKESKRKETHSYDYKEQEISQQNE